ncbi:MAG: DNA polymerase Y family protein, partial [Pararhodobacter sp.]|nr:DNA polymerase Y family protein [Pararhodobacter sp.]
MANGMTGGMTGGRTRHILSLWLPRLASEHALRRLGGAGGAFGGAADVPFAVIARQGGADRLLCLNPAAAAAGLRPGQPLAEARALVAGLITRPDAPAERARFLAALARWAWRHAPWVGHEGEDGLVLDITGAAHLAGGEAALAAQMHAALAAAGFNARLAVAPTRGAAWALARYGGQPVRLVTPEELRAALEPLPLAALRLEEETCAALARLGLRQVGDLHRASRASLGRRFGPAPWLRLDQALGALAEPVAPLPPPAPAAVRLTLPEPIGLKADVMAGLERLLARLCARLEARGEGARRLRLELRRAEGGRAETEVLFARAMRDAAAMAPLFERGIEALEAGFGFDTLRLSAPLVEPMAPEQLSAGPNPALRPASGAATGEAAGAAVAGGPAGALADLLTRLGNRLGEAALIRFRPADSHIPERAFQRVSAIWADAPAPGEGWPPAGRLRPLLLFAPEPVAVAGEGAPPRRVCGGRRGGPVGGAPRP